ncbi:molybdopterin molybdotransferase MoeA [Lignipirellula cremea]|uniref:Molybdopterin molybdenumtransferase n=1 Tax=Lignipirellula cremea TaxID=2528010 RepID=A0A518DX36_9BACT|nr:gephyrin-like molybdotransferase Glp [Lignipirellula cremea]QDU96406.1 Molybdopterin molybdenumtransferase [Lignipirellula cremea]
MLSTDEALAKILHESRPKTAAMTPLDQALGLVLAAAAISNVDSPPHEKALMDGYALRAADLAQQPAVLDVQEQITAGELPTLPVGPGQATRIMTGAPLPPGVDTVVMVERTTLRTTGGREQVEINDPTFKPGQNIMPQGLSIRTGDQVLPAGKRLRPVDIGLLAEAIGRNLLCFPRPQASVLATGNELTADDQPAPGQIRNSNGPMLLAAGEQAGAQMIDLGVARDDPESLRTAIARGLESDVLLLSGGVSAGVLDLTPSILRELGVREVFHKVRLKPGKPLWFGVREESGRRTLVFGLPGNPVSSLVCFELFARPAIAAIAGLDPTTLPVRHATLGADHAQRSDRPVFWPGHFDAVSNTASPLAWKGSADLRTLSQADCLILFPAGDRTWLPGDEVTIRPL